MKIKNINSVAKTALLLSVIVVMMGAYTRLTDAGLGCPDWPGCYGFVTVPETAEHISQAEAAFPHRPVEPHKAWNEMIHRYLASTLGLLIMIIFGMSLLAKRQDQAIRRPLKLALFLVLLVMFQGALGMWTVTMNLMPVIVMAHLLGGFATLSLLYLLVLRLSPSALTDGDSGVSGLLKPAIAGLVILILQIALGGWTAANYAATACTQLPICEADWLENLNIADAFSLQTGFSNYEFGVLQYPAAMTIHVFHRLGAILTALYLLWFGFKLYTQANSEFFKNLAKLLSLGLVVQFALGISNVYFGLPIAVAVLHNIVAVGLVLVLITIIYNISHKARGKA